MIISQIDSWSTPSVAFVRITTEDGAEGWGQTSPFQADITARFLHRNVAPIALGKETDDIDAIIDACFRERFIFKFFGTFLCRAVCGIDTALWDLKARRAGQSVCELLGGERRPQPVYASSMRRETTPEQEVERFQSWHERKGARAFKFKIAVPAGNNADSYPGRTEALVAAMGDAFPGDRHTLIADANSGYDVDHAIRVSHMLRDHGVSIFEEPVPCWDIDATAQVTREAAVTVAGGEQDYDMLRWRLILQQQAVGIAQPDVCYLGGLTRALRVAGMAADCGIPVMPHASNPSMVLLFSMHLMAAIPNAAPLLEYGIEDPAWVRDAFHPPLEMVDGHVAFPDDSGWGVAINPDWLDKAEHRVSRLE